MQITPNLGLKQPSQTDFYDVQDFNDNMQLIDDAIGDIADKVSGDLISKIYPVGSIYMSVNDVDPAVLFGGTWEKLPAGRCLIGAGSYTPTSTTSGDSAATYTLGKSGGQRAIKLTEGNMPAHRHAATVGLAGEHDHQVNICSKLPSGEPLSVIKRLTPNSAWTSSYTQYCVGQSTSAGSGSVFYLPHTSDAVSHKHTVTIGTNGSGSAFMSISPYLVVNMWKRTA